ncbi:baseplate J/gp47 family protein [Sphingosinicella sp. CPCC 101087]|uniref:baseplate J/gp47 family protein n=1 Tax=Sphingosinicella sp. CPCC 101087 TaxID=2497754 RepID=UPI00101CB7B0|nr:baseplate J/gp47 family protein [Sphingosinicella sp. CPCC 101087]
MATVLDQACRGCAGVTAEAPRQPDNRPGLPSVDVRIGDYGSFRRTQQALLSSSALGKLSELRTRETDDFSIALVDAWSVVGDILAFYSERLANEALVATAVEPQSLRELTRLIGYRPSPGVAAGARLAFAMSDAPGAPASVEIKAGAKVMSTPGEDEMPVTFETLSGIVARPEWNGIRPRLTRPHPLPATQTRLLLAGAATGVRPGDGLWYRADDGQSVFALVRRVKVLPADRAADPASVDMTEVRIERVGGAPSPAPSIDPTPATPAVSLTPVAQSVLGQTLSAGDVTKLITDAGVDEAALFGPYRDLPAPPRQVLVFRRRAAIFGHAAPRLKTLPQSLIGDTITYEIEENGDVVIDEIIPGPFKGKTEAQWADTGDLTLLSDGGSNVYLDAVYDGADTDSYVVLRDGSTWSLYQIDAATELTKSEFTVSGKCTRLTLHASTGFSSFKIRTASAYVESELLTLAEEPIADAVIDGNASPIELDGWYPGLEPGRPVLLSGGLSGGGAEPAARAVALAEVEHVFAPGGGTRSRITPALTDALLRRSVRINANVAEATHGESVFEVLGGGDSRVAFQTFRTRQAPQTHLTAPVPGGAAPTLKVRVNDMLWTEVPTLLGHGPQERIYVTRIDAEGHSIITFGDGITGARLPTGIDNVRCEYRKGLGLEGRVRAHQLNQPTTRPLGLVGVDNPLPAEGGADAEAGDAIRQSAPVQVRTLDRTVSLLDYEDFVRAYAGIAKALAVPIWDGVGELVFVTAAAEGGDPIPDPGTIRSALTAAVAGAGDPYARFHVGDHVPVHFRVGLAVKADAAFVADDVLSAVEAALRADFGFERRGFAQPVAASEVLAAVHGVSGVVAARLTALYRAESGGGNAARLHADPPRREPNGALRGAELLSLDPGPLDTLVLMP